MIKATANTNVRAVLQHGGGLAHTQQPRTNARGRQLTPRGGVINRRCEATSIIPLPFPSSAAAVYPLTGVRRARKLSPSLRSNNRPHAQLVVGYMLVLLNALKISKRLNSFSCIGIEIVKPLEIEIYSPHKRFLVTQPHNNLQTVRRSNLHLTQEVYLPGRKFCNRYSPESFDCGRPRKMRSALQIYVDHEFAVALARRGQSGTKLICSNSLLPRHQQQHSAQLVSTSIAAGALVHVGERGSHNYSQECSDNSNPPDHSWVSPRNNNQQPTEDERAHHRGRSKPHALQQRAQSKANANFLIQHVLILTSTPALSLQAPRHYVQRGAA